MLDPLYCHSCNRGNLDGPTIAACRRTYCDARKTAEKLDAITQRKKWDLERQQEAMHQPIDMIDAYDKWMP